MILENQRSLGVKGFFCTNPTFKHYLYLSLYLRKSLFSAITSVLCDIVPKIAGLRGSIILHKDVLTKVFHFPMSWFEINPIGRVLSR